MLDALGLHSIDELFQSIPSNLKIPRPQQDDGLSEYEGLKWMEALAARNSFASFDSYLGAGAYEHHVPAIVAAICSKSEFLTAYTPYQAEASQGMLQVIFEFQSAICALTGMDVSNASVYDGASACAEAILMALRHHKTRKNIIVAETLHPHYRGVIEQYVFNQEIEIRTAPCLEDGSIDQAWLNAYTDSETAAILLQSPNFLGLVEEVKEVVEISQKVGALTILCANPLVYGLFSSAKELGVDIAVGDCQPIGIPLQFGGPYAGYLACRENLVRQMPGRIVGETVDEKGEGGFVLTLQAREQHIRREKATSNICTNQALAALASLVAILWYGKRGLHHLALTNYQRAAYLKGKLSAFCKIREGTTFNEFVVHFKTPLSKVFEHFRSKQIEPGLDLGIYFPKLAGSLLVAVTETKNLEQLDQYIEAARDVECHSLQTGG